MRVRALRYVAKLASRVEVQRAPIKALPPHPLAQNRCQLVDVLVCGVSGQHQHGAQQAHSTHP